MTPPPRIPPQDATLSDLGFAVEEVLMLEQLLRHGQGLVLVAGPPGSGRTSTLYAMLRSLATRGARIATVEREIGCAIRGAYQLKVDEEAGLTFAAFAQSLLRRNLDVLMVGALPDRATTEAVVEAATGRLVLACVDATDTARVIAKLGELGVDPPTLGPVLRGIVSQRLLRRLCRSCRQPVRLEELPAAQQALFQATEVRELSGAGSCAECGGTGYHGRFAIAEIAPVWPAARRAVAVGVPPHQVAELCRASGMLSLWDSGMHRVAYGATSLHELLDTVSPPKPGRTQQPVTQDDIDALVDALLGERGPVAPKAPAATAIAAPPAHDVPSAHCGAQPVDGDAPLPAGAEPAPQSASPVQEPEPPAAETAPPPPARAPIPRVLPVPLPTGAADDADPGDRPQVLLVEPDVALRRAVRTGLETEGFIVLEAENGHAALECLRRVRPPFVVTEMALPLVDGLALLRAMRQGRVPQAETLVLTGEDDEELRSWSLELGALEFLVKPVSPRVLGARLRARLAEWAA